MQFILSAVALATIHFGKPTFGQNVTIEGVSSAFRQASVVPDVLSSFNPSGILDVVFTDPATSQQIQVIPGMNLTRSQTSRQPMLGISELPPSFAPQTFVVAMIDPDSPTPSSPSSAQIRHMLGGDFTLQGGLSETSQRLVNASSLITEYNGPNPPSGSAPHRYVLLVYNQPTAPGPNPSTNFSATVAPFVNSTTPRSNFNISRFAEEVGLTGPVAGTFFYVGLATSGVTTTASGTAVSTTGGGGGSTTATNADSPTPTPNASARCLVPGVLLVLSALVYFVL